MLSSTGKLISIYSGVSKTALRSGLVKREAREIRARTRHRNKGATPIHHWKHPKLHVHFADSGKMADAMIFKSGDLPEYGTESLVLSCHE